MSKRTNPLIRRTTPQPALEPEIVDDEGGADIIPMNETFPGMPPMSVREKKRLAELEDVVTRNFKAFYEVGSALREISESLLYRETHSNFADYVKDLWDMARARAYQMIDAANIVDRLLPLEEELSTNCRRNEVVYHGGQSKMVLPQNERQARALAKYPEDKQIQIWREAVETADGRITAAHIKQTARRIHGEIVKNTIKKAKTETSSPAVKMSNAFRQAFNAMMDAINDERLKDWKETDPNEAARFVHALLQAIQHPL
ncbi:hypothetical protein Dvar_68540 [Desulfosarcina variabilis str. Montpellier]|uniref:hypothetical protein n=1 Tax=Desulfosarcina variabilis TaxID=2300 RepID=UPI003AFB0476